MTANERRVVFVHSKMCSIYDELNHALRFFDREENDGEPSKEFLEIQPMVIEAYLAAEKAHDALSRLVDKNTDFGGE